MLDELANGEQMNTRKIMRSGLGGVFALSLLLAAGSASAQDWHISGLSERAAVLPDSDNDGPGNRMGTSTCEFIMPQGGGYQASLLVYSSRGMAPYASARIASPSWERLEFQGQLNRYSPNIAINIQCMDPNDPSVQEAFTSGWQLVGYDDPLPNFECPAEKPVLVQAWCQTAAYW
jgi:hypothetical protein